MLIIIDYDDTYTADPVLWDMFIMSAWHRGHTIVCCTIRPDHPDFNTDIVASIGAKGVPIIYAALYSDKWEAVRAAGYDPKDAIWIDDRPMYIFMDRPMDEWPD